MYQSDELFQHHWTLELWRLSYSDYENHKNSFLYLWHSPMLLMKIMVGIMAAAQGVNHGKGWGFN